MRHKWFSSIAFAFSILIAIALGQVPQEHFRVWKDTTGKYRIEATLVSRSQTSVVIKTREGKEIQVAIEKLSTEDIEYLNLDSESSSKMDDAEESESKESSQESRKASSGLEPEQIVIKKLAESFFAELRSNDRMQACEMLTEKGKELASAQKSALPFLPSPDKGARAIRVGKPTIQKEEASVVVAVMVGRVQQKTMLDFKKEDGQWRVSSISASRGDTEVTIDFEEAYEPDAQSQGSGPQSSNGPLDITGITLDGRKVSLADYKGKVVLIDFWATWCGPCMKEIPNVYQNYAKYHGLGFEVLAISLDKDMGELQEFIVKNNPPWPVLADMHPSNPVRMASKYKVTAIPTMILVGPEGNIIDPNCRGERLTARLAEIFKR